MRIRVFISALIAFLAGLSVAPPGALAPGTGSQPGLGGLEFSPALAHEIPGTKASIADVAERSVPSVVNISSIKVIRSRRRVSPFFSDPFFRFFFRGRRRGVPREQRKRSLGSGVIVSEDGIILTNNHVVANSSRIKVTLSDQRDFIATVVGADPKSDLAVLRLRGKVQGLKPLRFGDSSRLRLGSVVLAIGNPFGVGQTVTMGIVSAKGRANVGIVDYEDFIQTDAAINPGNSGGALVDLRGNLVGINTAILSRSGGYQGIGFAIPANMARPIMESLLKFGKVVRGWLGVSVQKLTPELAKMFGLKATSGVLVSDVTAGSPAEKAGLRRGDVVVSFNGEKMVTTGRLRNLVAVAGSGGKIRLEILRENARKVVEVTLEEMPVTAGGVASFGEREGALGGMTVVGLSSAAREKYKIPDKLRHGVVVEKLTPDSPAAEAGVRPGDVILEINRRQVRSIRDFEQTYRAIRGRILLLVYRKGSTVYLLLSR